MKKIFSILVILFFYNSIDAKNNKTNPIGLKIHPTYWWKNSVHKNLQLLIQYKNIRNLAYVSSSDVNFIVDSIVPLDNNDAIFLYVHFTTNVGNLVKLNFKDTQKTHTFYYAFQTLDKSKVNTINEKDMMYLIFPDRFSNGNLNNDKIKGLKDQSLDRQAFQSRHGGDIEGVINHLNYVQDLGMTCIWLNPTLINDQKSGSYHGYALTDYYTTDPRFGTNEDYKRLGDELEKRNMKLVWDLVPNHVGSEHPWIENKMYKNFIHHWDTFTQCNFKPMIWSNPYKSKYDQEHVEKGWFVPTMPDVNEEDIHVANYLKQSYLWWVNYAGIDGFRIDTYPYNNLNFMNECLSYIYQEYPNFYTTGESWEKGSISHMAYFTQNSGLKYAPKNNALNSTIDFHFFWSVLNGINKDAEWDNGIIELYNTLSQDGMYQNPNLNLTFVDNHDIDRYFALVGEDIKKWKLGLVLLYTLRGVPCLYYGTELLFTSHSPRLDDGEVRQDFPGGWPTDLKNKFENTNRTIEENQAFAFVKKLTEIRSKYSAFTSGKLTTFIPKDGLFSYILEGQNEKFLVMLNKGKTKQTLPYQNYAEFELNSQAMDLITEQYVDWKNLQLDVNDFIILKY